MLRSSSFLSRAAAMIAAATLLTACGGSGSNGASHRGGATTVRLNGELMTVAQANRHLLRFASCMRTHGVEGLPNPVAAPRAFKQSFNNSPTFVAANAVCGHLLPGQQGPQTGARHTRRQIDAMLAFARCMRAHGFSRFPDPTSDGSLTHQMLSQAGIDLHQPAVVQSADGCARFTHGLITRAMVARFVAGH